MAVRSASREQRCQQLLGYQAHAAQVLVNLNTIPIPDCDSLYELFLGL